MALVYDDGILNDGVLYDGVLVLLQMSLVQAGLLQARLAVNHRAEILLRSILTAVLVVGLEGVDEAHGA